MPVQPPDEAQRLDAVQVQENEPGKERALVQAQFCKAGKVKQV